MAWVAQFDTQMLKDGYTPTEAMIYGYLWWVTWKTEIQDAITPSIGLMKKTLHLGRTTIIRGIQRLEDRGLIDVVRTYRERNAYVIVDMEKYSPCSNYNPDMVPSRNRKKQWYQNGTRVVPDWY